MSEFNPHLFENKYVHYLLELETVYKNAFSTMLERFDSQVIHAIDQGVLVESEPIYKDAEFHILLPDNPGALMGSILIDNETLNQILNEYVTELTRELQFMFGTK